MKQIAFNIHYYFILQIRLFIGGGHVLLQGGDEDKKYKSMTKQGGKSVLTNQPRAETFKRSSTYLFMKPMQPYLGTPGNQWNANILSWFNISVLRSCDPAAFFGNPLPAEPSFRQATDADFLRYRTVEELQEQTKDRDPPANVEVIKLLRFLQRIHVEHYKHISPTQETHVDTIAQLLLTILGYEGNGTHLLSLRENLKLEMGSWTRAETDMALLDTATLLIVYFVQENKKETIDAEAQLIAEAIAAVQQREKVFKDIFRRPSSNITVRVVMTLILPMFSNSPDVL